jgi:hypothetical protein
MGRIFVIVVLIVGRRGIKSTGRWLGGREIKRIVVFKGKSTESFGGRQRKRTRSPMFGATLGYRREFIFIVVVVFLFVVAIFVFSVFSKSESVVVVFHRRPSFSPISPIPPKIPVLSPHTIPTVIKYTQQSTIIRLKCLILGGVACF